MGCRTVVMLNNDLMTLWANDVGLGKKIAYGILHSYGEVVEQVHADTQTLVHLDGYCSFKPLASTMAITIAGKSTDDLSIALIKSAADKLGYKLIKKSKKG